MGLAILAECAILQPMGSHPDPHCEEFLRLLMHRQLRLSVTCAATFLVCLFGLPLANYFFPELMATRVGGFTLSWLILGVLMFPLVWIIAYIFIQRSLKLEADEVRQVKGDNAR